MSWAGNGYTGATSGTIFNDADGESGPACDFDGAAVGITDMFQPLANWGCAPECHPARQPPVVRE